MGYDCLGQFKMKILLSYGDLQSYNPFTGRWAASKLHLQRCKVEVVLQEQMLQHRRYIIEKVIGTATVNMFEVSLVGKDVNACTNLCQRLQGVCALVGDHLHKNIPKEH